MDETTEVDVFEDNGVLMLRYPDGSVEAYDDYMRRTEPGMSYDNATGELIVATPASAEAGMMPGGETPADTFGDTTSRMASPYFEAAADLASTAGRRPTYFQNPLMQGLERTGQYIGDMGLAGLNAALGGVYGGAGLLGEAFGGDTQNERRLARDLAAMFDVAGPAPEGRALGLLTDAAMAGRVADTAAEFLPSEQGGMKLYHGSPHDFDRFSMSKIGTGEGAQAYGPGLYFAENEGIARSYRDQLSRDVFYDGRPVASVHPLDNPQAGAIHSVAKAVADGIPAERAMAFEAGQWRAWAEPYLRAAQDNPQLASEAARRAQSMTDIAAAIEALDPQRFVKNPGRMYEVEVNANPEDFLDWDRPLSEQPQVVRDFANARWQQIYGRAPDPAIEGEYIAKMASPQGGIDSPDWLLRGGPGDAQRERLREAGIPGIRYLDASSRGAGDGSRNYVIFDENLINIVRKYGIAGAATMLGVSAFDVGQAMAQGQQQPQGLLSMGAQ